MTSDQNFRQQGNTGAAGNDVNQGHDVVAGATAIGFDFQFA